MKSLLLALACIFSCTIFSQTTYYSKSVGNLNVLGTWGTNTNGTGAAPANFTTANCTYIITNNAAPTIAANWTVSGAGSKVLVGDGIQTINFTIPSPRTTTATYSVMVNSTLTAASGSTLSASTVHVDGIFDNATNNNPTLGTLGAGSTVKYSRAGNQTVVNAAYGNLQLNGSGAKAAANIASSSVSALLTISAGVTFALSTNNSFTWSLNGTITGAGTITGGNNSNLTIGGAGAFGTLNFTGASQNLAAFNINRTSSGTLTLGGSVNVRGSFTHTNGVVTIGANTITFSAGVTFPASLANGSLTGSASSNLTFSASSIANSLLLTAGSETLNALIVNCPGLTLSLGTNVTVLTTYTHSRGIINLNGKTLTLSGAVSFSASAANGTTTGSAASNLIVNATTIANSFFMTVGSNLLNNFTLNSAGVNFTMGNSMTVSGAFTHTNGVFRLNGQALTLSGTVVFTAALANGTITGTAASDLTISASSVTNNIIFTTGATTLRNLTLNCGAQTVTLGTALTVSGAFNQTTGTLALNGNTLTLSGTITFPTSLANGNIKGSATSNLSISATSITNRLYLTTGFQTLNNFTLNSSGQTLALGTNLTVGGTYTHTRGIVNINGQTLTLNGATTFASSVANGTTSGSAASNLILNSTAITNSFFMTVGSQTLNNFTLNSAGLNFTMGTAMTVSGAFTHTAGIFRLNAQALTLSGTVTFPVASANGTMTGTNTSDLTVSASSITNVLNFTAGALALRNLTFNSPAQTLTLGTNLTLSGALAHTAGMLNINGKTLALNGIITFPTSAAGSFTGSSTSLLSIGGAGAISNSLFMTQAGTGSYLNNLTLNRNGQTVTLGNTMNLVGTLTPTSGIFASAGNLVLLATSSTVVARIGVIGATGSVTGSVTAQMYAKGGTTGWTTMGSPGLTGRTFSDWDDNTTITCASCPDGYTIGGSPFTSVVWYDETVGGLYTNSARYININNITDAMTIGKGFWVFLGTALTTTSDILLDAKGPVNQGNFAVNLTRTNIGGGTQATDHGYNLISNPYPSPIQWTLLRNGNANVANAIYVYNPDLSGYASFVGGVSSPAVGSGGIGNSIPAGQAFYVKANAAAITLTGQETNKAASAQELLKMSGQQMQSSSNPMVMRLHASGHNMQFETAIYFDAGATSNYDIEYDAQYMEPDAGYLGISTKLNGMEYAINGMPDLNQNYSIPVKVTTDTTGAYSISATDLQNLPGGACIILHDNYTGLDKDLRLGAYSCTVMDTEKVAARFVLNITANPGLVVNGNSVNPTCSNILNGKLIALPNGSGPWNYYWKDANNNIIKTTLNKASADTLYNVGVGNFSVDVNTAGSCDNGSVNFTLNASNVAVASYNPSATTVIFVADSIGVAFTNTSNNANSYWWDFGDGMGDSNVNQYHNYTTPGDYVVTLAAIGPCGDTTYSSQVISVVDASSVGIAAIAEPTQNMFISRDVNGYYVQFNYKENTNAHISVQNILGEKIVADQNAPHVSKDKVYISLGDNSNKILIISVVTDSGEKTYCKVIN